MMALRFSKRKQKVAQEGESAGRIDNVRMIVSLAGCKKGYAKRVVCGEGRALGWRIETSIRAVGVARLVMPCRRQRLRRLPLLLFG